MAARALRRRRIDFGVSKPMVSIIGDYISDKIRAEGIYEREYLEFLRDRLFEPGLCKQQVAVDVGANIGNHSLFLSDIFGRVIAFEPNPLARSILEINLHLNGVQNVEVKPVGLSDRVAKVNLVFGFDNLGAATPSSTSEAGVRCTSEVDLVVGDETIDRSAPIGFLKVDIEGSEEAALKGLIRTLRSHQPIVMIEQWGGAIDARSGTSPSFLFLQGLGYSAWEITSPRAFRGNAGKLTSLLFGRTDFHMSAVSRLEKRQYLALIFTPPSYTFSEFDETTVGSGG